MSQEEIGSQDNCIIDDYILKESVKLCIYGWDEVILELYDSGRERLAKKLLTYRVQKTLN